MTKEEILRVVSDKSRNYQVKFTKSNGDERFMRFTLNPELIGDLNMTPKGNGTPHNDDILKVVELCDNGEVQWRSFRLDSVISIEEYNPE